MRYLLLFTIFFLLCACAEDDSGFSGSERDAYLENFYFLENSGYVDIERDGGGYVAIEIPRFIVENLDGSTGIIPWNGINNVILQPDKSVYYFTNLVYVAEDNVKDPDGNIISGTYLTFFRIKLIDDILNVHITVNEHAGVLTDYTIKSVDKVIK